MIRRSFGLLTLSVLPLATAAASGVDLKPKLSAGTEVHYLMTTRHDVTQKVAAEGDEPAQEMKMVRTTQVGMRLRCTEVKADGSGVFEWSLLYLALSAEGGMPMDYDSRDPSQHDSPIAGMVEQILNQPATITVDPAGKVTEYKDPASVGGGPVRSLMDGLFSKEAFERMSLVSIPGAPTDAAVGATWSQADPVDLPEGLGIMLITSNYKLENAKDDAKTADLAIQATMTMKQPEPAADGTPAPPPGMVINKGESTGKCQWDCKAGQLLTADNHSTLIAKATGGFGKVDFQQIADNTVKRVTAEEFRAAAQKPAAASQPGAASKPAEGAPAAATQPAGGPKPAPDAKPEAGSAAPKPAEKGEKPKG
jgi:hypothetical protein